MKKFHEDLRYEYNLSPDDVVLDCGGFEGNFAKKIAVMYNCRVIVFEPVLEFYRKCVENLKDLKKVSVYNTGLAATSCKTEFKISGDSTGAFNLNQQAAAEVVSLTGIAEMLSMLWVEEVALLKLNCEGAEFEIMEEILKRGLAKKFKYLQIQPHRVVKDCDERWEMIMNRLQDTHDIMWYEPWVWLGMERKKPCV